MGVRCVRASTHSLKHGCRVLLSLRQLHRTTQMATQASFTQGESAAERLIAALQQRDEAATELEAAQDAAQEPDHLALQRQHSELQQQLQQLAQGIKQQRGMDGAGGGRAGRGARQGRDAAAAQEEAGAGDGDAPATGAGEGSGREGRQQRSSKRKKM